ncbi:MAG TPA: hypothetical protein VMD28_06325 [Acidimicrobiales bacterium]|nr:hypothetical protein [Acidimicrobiales bacterium]
MSFDVREVEVTAFFTVSFAAGFLAAFVVLFPASLRVDPAACRVPEDGGFAAGLAALRAGAVATPARARATSFRGAGLALRALPLLAAAGLRATLAVRPPFATVG